MSRADPFAMSAELAADGVIEVTLSVSRDDRPLGEFHPFVSVPLDEDHATELLGTLAGALQTLRVRRGDPA